MRVVYASSIDRFGPLSHLRALAPAVAKEGGEVKVLCLDEAVADSFRALGVDAAVTPLTSKSTYAAPRQSGVISPAPTSCTPRIRGPVCSCALRRMRAG